MRGILLLLACGLAWTISAGASAQWGTGWEIPANAEKEGSPLASTDEVLERGQAVFERSCRRCHGLTGKGDGPDSDPRNPAADLTDTSPADLDPDGVMFYRIWNGRQRIMPAFKSQLAREEVWAVVAYVRSLQSK